MKYELAERVLRRRQPYGHKKDVREGYVVLDTETGNIVSELIPEKKDAESRTFRLNKTFTEGSKPCQ